MMRAALLCLVVTLVQAGTITETEKCEDQHDVSPPDDWETWGRRFYVLGECGKTIGDDLKTLITDISNGGDWENTLERLDEIVEKTSKVIFHARLLYGPMLTMPSPFDFTYCGVLAELAKVKGSAATTSERHGAILSDARCFSSLIKAAFTLKWMDPKVDESQHSMLFIEAVEHLKRLMHEGTLFHNGLTKLTGGVVRKSSDSGHHTDVVSDDLKNNILERLLKALKSEP